MKHRKNLLSLVLALCMILSMFPTVVFAEDAAEKTDDIVIIYTNDIHTYVNGTLSYDTVAAMKAEAAEASKGVILVDAGDHIQGTDYGAADEGENVMKLMKAAGYDFATLGNHEFDYGMDRVLEIIDADTYGIDYICCNFYEVKDGVVGDNVLDSYKVFDFDGTKVALIGFTTPESQSKAVSTFRDADGNDIYGVAGYENTQDLFDSVQRAIDAASEEADYVIAVGHMGDMESSGDWVSANVIANTTGLDAFIDAHSHNTYECNVVKDKDGNDVILTQTGAYFNAIGKLTISADGTITTQLVKEYEGSDAAVKEFQEETWNAYMGQTLAIATGDFPSNDLGTKPSAFVDLLGAVQIWGTYDRTGNNTPEDASDDEPAMLAITAPLNSGSSGNIIDAGEIQLGDIYNLYRFENWFYQIRMTGEELHQWLEFAASKIEVDENGEPFVTSANLTYYDIVYGEGFSYIIDYTKNAGERVISMTYYGEEVTADQEFTVALNNFRYKDGGGYLTYLTEHGCPFEANDPDRVIYSTQYDMIEGANLGTARALLMAYIREQGTLSPDIISTWKLVGSASAITHEEPVVASTNREGTNIPTYVTLPGGYDADGSYPLVVMLHGHGGNHNEWGGYDAISDALAENGIIVVTMDFPGCGASTESFTLNNMTNMKNDVVDVFHYMVENYAVDTTKVGGFGYSMGGRLILELTAEEKIDFATIELVAPAAGDMTASWGGAEAWEYMKNEALTNGYYQITTVYGQVQQLGYQFFVDLETYATGLAELAAEKYNGNTLVVWATDDAAVSPETAEAVAEAFGAATVNTYTNGHSYSFYGTDPYTVSTVNNACTNYFVNELLGEPEDYVARIEDDGSLTLTTTVDTLGTITEGVAVDVTIDGETYEATYVLSADEVKDGTLVLLNNDGTLTLTLKGGNFVTTNGIATKNVTEDGAIEWYYSDDVSIPLTVSVKAEPYFTDLAADTWYYEYVMAAAKAGLVSGYTDGTFRPEETLTRAEAAMLLYRLSGSPEVEGIASFTDLVNGWYDEAIAWAEETGIVNGFSDGTFRPDESVTREQFVTMVWRLNGEPEATASLEGFVDADAVQTYAQTAFAWAVENGIVNGITSYQWEGVRLAPQDNIKRCEAAKIFVICLEK